MTGDDHQVSEIAAAVAEFQRDIPHQFQVSLSMSVETRDHLGEIRDELNELAGERVFDTNDAMRVALLAAARYHAFATGELPESEPIDTEQLIPLASVLRRVLADDERVPDLPDERPD